MGNLPYSMTSAQLAEVFEEAGRVVSVEVCDFPFPNYCFTYNSCMSNILQSLFSSM